MKNDEYERVMKANYREVEPSPLLTDMRWVFDNPGEKGESESIVNCRAMLKKSHRLFLERMSALEKEYLQAVKAFHERKAEEARARAKEMPSRSEEVEGPDEGEERVLELAEQVLRDLDAESGQVARKGPQGPA